MRCSAVLTAEMVGRGNGNGNGDGGLVRRPGREERKGEGRESMVEMCKGAFGFDDYLYNIIYKLRVYITT